MQNCFVLDLNRCTGCHACQVACKVENELPEDMNWRQVVTFNEPHLPGIPLYHFSLACNHCVDAPCKTLCPALAYRKDEKTGAVTIDPKLCMGCKYCEWVCPYDAPRFNASAGVMEKCTFCSHRLSEGLEPACTAACPTDALQFDRFTKEDKKERIDVAGFWHRNIAPAIRILPLRRGSRPPQMSHEQSHDAMSARARQKRIRSSKVSLRSEWPLLAFTMTAALLVAFFHARVLVGFRVDWVTFALIGAVAMGLSTLHLGKKLRFYRAILNWRRSWVSREVVLFSAFFAGAIYCLGFAPKDIVLARAVAALGFAALFAMDKVYQVNTVVSARGLHSASVLLTGLYFVGILTTYIWFIIPLALAKLVLYLLRRLHKLHRMPRMRQALFAVRILAGFVIPAALWYSQGLLAHRPILLSILLGEIIDRVEFYLDLDFTTPPSKVATDLETVVAHKPLVLT
jgi:Fe-S-cluster-containing dehydrogenase component/DMSO reductase anchor subunit